MERKIKNENDLGKLKREISKKYQVPCLSNVLILKAYHKLIEKKRIRPSFELEFLLRKRKVRSLSGIVVVSVLTKPFPCPGKCIFCPLQKGVPKSYLNSEPAVMRAILNKYHPFFQVKSRIESLKLAGHPIDKIELRIIGGTWSFYPPQYQTWFLKECFGAANGKKRKSNENLEKIQKENEKAKSKIVGINIETRPDYINLKEIKRLRKLGVTKVELGVQSLYDQILKISKRGHKVKETILATKLLKDAGFKICYQMMPNLPGANLDLDKKMFRELFENPQFKPDFLKIYPTCLLKEAPLYQWWKKGKYKPYSLSELLSLLKEIKKIVPFYCRIQRVIRDIPADKIVEGPTKISNLREIVLKEMKKENIFCQCIRCREIKANYSPDEKVYLFREDYQASGGREIFLSFEDKERKRLYSLLRLRIPSQFFEKKRHFLSVLEKSALLRELRTFGQLLPIGEKNKIFSPQHKGLGKKLVKEAEKIAKKEFSLKKIAVISGVGARPYWRKLGYYLKDTYMIKNL